MNRLRCLTLLATCFFGLVPAQAFGQYGVRPSAYQQVYYQQAYCQQAILQQVMYQQAAYDLQQQAVYQQVAYQQGLQQQAVQQAAFQQALRQQSTCPQAPYQYAGYQHSSYQPSSPNLNAGVYYRPPGLPISINVGSDGISIEATSEITTPIGTFGVRGGVGR